MTQPTAPAPHSHTGAPVPVVVLRSKLRSLPVAERLRLSLFVLLLGCGYFAGFVYIQYTTVPEDESPISTRMPEWIAAKYHGTGVPKLIAKLSPGGNMREHLADPDTNLAKLQAWYAAEMPETEFGAVRKIFDTTGPQGKSCLECHCRYDADGEDGKKKDAPLETYADTVKQMKTDRMSAASLVRLTHFHLIGMGLMAFGFTWVWMQTAFRNPWRGIFMVLPFAAIGVDIGGWWLTWLHPTGAYLVLLGGGLYGLSSLVLTAGPLFDMWLRRCPLCSAAETSVPPQQESAP